ncbi:hypothetical protein [Paraburkholderia caribensis]|uniref:hypothetical protein n=1 Tax=Paraburkholderia caribensis TaxID=75105 RepID=UPI0034D1FFE4
MDAPKSRPPERNTRALAKYRLSELLASADIENAFSALARYDLNQGETSPASAGAPTSTAYSNGRSSHLHLLEAVAQLQRAQEARIQA